MDRKLSNIENNVQRRSAEFHEYLLDHLPPKIIRFAERLQTQTKVYLFSGIIRDFFLKYHYEPRDVDFIIKDDLNVKKLFPRLRIDRNSFGGYKTKIESTSVDLWGLDTTWGLNRGQLKLQFGKLYYLPQTTFFNFSSIVYSLDDREFIIGKPFLRFLRDRTLDIVLEENPIPSLCIINSFFYAEKYNLKLSEKLRKYLVNNYPLHADSLQETQVRHFHRVLYRKSTLDRKIKALE